MICKLQVVTLGEDGRQETGEIACLKRTDLKPETLGLTLAEGKRILKDLQQIMVEGQVASFLLPKRPCPDCGQPRCAKGHHTLSIRTVFGQLTVRSPRLHQQGPFEVIAGKSLLAFKRNQEGEQELSTRCFAWCGEKR
jgi:hypothetical protein